MNNPLTIARAVELRSLREAFEIRWTDGRVSGGFDSPEQAAESVDAQGSDFPLPGRLAFDGTYLRSEGERVGEIVESPGD